MNSFIYDIPTKVYFGEDQLCHLGEELKKYGTRVLMTYGGGSIKKMGLYDKVVEEIKSAGLTLFELSGIEPNPRIDSVRKGAQICKDEKIDVLLAVGGGSTLDATKWMAAGACVEHDPWDFFSKWLPVEKALPVLDILTLAATGSEMDAGGVISNPETQDKIGRIAEPLLPKVSFLDPSNTYTVSPYQTACGAADMMSHIMEVYFNMNTDLYTPYPEDYDECTEVARQEQSENARPALTASVDNMQDYDVIFLGYPIWWGDMPMAVYTFLESYDFSGKTIVPFCTHEGSGLSSTERSIASTCSGAEVLDGLAIRGSVAQSSQDEAQAAVTNWLQEAGFID